MFLRYRLKQIDNDGKFSFSDEIEVNVKYIPSEFSLEQNFPNPFNPTTKVKYSVPTSEIVQIKVYDVLGKEISTLLNEFKDAGTYEVEFNADDLSSGLYFYQITSGSYSETKKMILLR